MFPTNLDPRRLQSLTLAIEQFRLRQVRTCVPLVNRLEREARFRIWLQTLQKFPVTRGLLSWLVGYHRPYSSLSEAREAIATLSNGGHANSHNARMHLSLAERARPSDYPAMFHIQSVLAQVRSVFDLGGNVGNLFYCYSRYLSFDPDMRWSVFDVPEMRSQGQTLADDRGETRLRFVSSMDSMAGCDLLLASGSLHYFEEPLHLTLGRLANKPKYVLINRTPLAEDGSTATVQDNGVFLVPCTVFDRKTVIAGFVNNGYQLVDYWPVTELSLQIPFHPECSAPSYSGMFFQRTDC